VAGETAWVDTSGSDWFPLSAPKTLAELPRLLPSLELHEIPFHPGGSVGGGNGAAPCSPL